MVNGVVPVVPRNGGVWLASVAHVVELECVVLMPSTTGSAVLPWLVFSVLWLDLNIMMFMVPFGTLWVKNQSSLS